MKPKISFDSTRVKQIFLTHGEKIGLAVGVLVAAYAIYCAMLIEPYDKEPEKKNPEKMTADVRLARDNLNTSDKKRMKLEVDGVKLPPDGFSARIDRELIAPIDPARFVEYEWNKPLFETKQRRREPEYLALRDPQAVFYHSAVNLKSGGEKEKGLPVGEEWITVTGVVPLEEQTAKYSAAFKNALDTLTNSAPVYGVYEIRRAEITSTEAVDWDKIQPLDLHHAIDEQIGRWTEEPGPEYVDDQYIRRPLTEPLPPLTNKDYGDWCRHPEVPVAPPPDVGAPAPEPEAPVANFIGGNKAAAPVPVPAKAAVAEKNAPKKSGNILLFRFFDFQIESGKKYQYQVRLVLNNPNYKLDLAHLETPELAQGETRSAPWSTATPTVGVPYLDRFVDGAVRPVGGDNEPELTAAVKQWFPNLAAEGFIRFDKLLRGAMLDAPNATVSYRAPGVGVGAKQQLPYHSGTLLVDFGWERTDARLKGPNDRITERPSEALMLNPRGELIICVQTMDLSVWEEDKNVQQGVGTGPAAGAPGLSIPRPPGTTAPAGGAPANGPPKKSIFDVK